MSWSGFYAGIHAGAGWSETDYRFPVGNFFGAAGTTFSLEPEGAVYGGQLGYNFQFGSFVLGAEVSYSGSTMRDEILGIVPAFPQDRWFGRVDDIFTATGRIGYATPSMLLYAKGGYASAEVGLSAISGPPGAGVTFGDKTRTDGWVIAGGLEYRLARNLSLGVEYNHIELEGARFTQVPPLAAVTADMSDLTIQTVTARLNILFGQ